MIIIFKENAPEKDVRLLEEEIRALGLDIHKSRDRIRCFGALWAIRPKSIWTGWPPGRLSNP